VLAVAAGEEEGAPVPLLLGVKNVVAEIEIEIGSGSILLLDWRSRSPPPKKNTRRGTNHSRQNFMVLMAAAAAASSSPANRESSPLSLSLVWFLKTNKEKPCPTRRPQ
jgi:hypothetical protein